MTQEQIVSGCLKGDSVARKELYECYADRLLFICRRYMADSQSAEDLLHDTFIKIFGAIDKFSWRGEGSLRAWMERVTVNMALEELRRQKKIQTTDIELVPNLSADPTPEETQRVPHELLLRFIEELPTGYRTIFNLFCVEEYSHREIAKMLEINEKSSSSQLFRAKALLAQKIKNYLASTKD